MERKCEALEEKYKDSSKDVEMFKHKATAIEKRSQDTIDAKNKAEKEVINLTEENVSFIQERDELKEKFAKFEEDIA
jgi:SMC interacting uncharacterized protein involved in chromosome segregation